MLTYIQAVHTEHFSFRRLTAGTLALSTVSSYLFLVLTSSSNFCSVNGFGLFQYCLLLNTLLSYQLLYAQICHYNGIFSPLALFYGFTLFAAFPR